MTTARKFLKFKGHLHPSTNPPFQKQPTS